MAAALQLIPLGPAWRNALSPHAAALDSALRLDAAEPKWRPLSVDPDLTATWLPCGVAAIALFWAARELFGATAVRRTARAIAWIGFAVSLVAIVQLYSSPYLIYWTFQPVDAGSRTAGPFVNRNHLATWLILALPTTVGYLIARIHAHAGDGTRERAAAAVESLDARTLWLLGAAAAMLAALIACQSRAGLIGIAASGGAGVLLPAMGGRRVGRRWAAVVLVAAVAVAAALANTGRLLARFEQVRADPVGGRSAIWRETLPVVRDFALTGTGVAAYPTAMLVYEDHRAHPFFYNQAHDQYLQFAAEGGLLVGIPILLAIWGFGRAAGRSLRDDRSPLFWLRAGAAAALVGVAVQSVWETGLRMPANALLCAIVAAIVVHRIDGHAQRGRNQEGAPRNARYT